jgi:hypothetical protein
MVAKKAAKKQIKTASEKMGGGLFAYGQHVDKTDKVKPLFASWDTVTGKGKKPGRR